MIAGFILPPQPIVYSHMRIICINKCASDRCGYTGLETRVLLLGTELEKKLYIYAPEVGRLMIRRTVYTVRKAWRRFFLFYIGTTYIFTDRDR